MKYLVELCAGDDLTLRDDYSTDQLPSPQLAMMRALADYCDCRPALLTKALSEPDALTVTFYGRPINNRDEEPLITVKPQWRAGWPTATGPTALGALLRAAFHELTEDFVEVLGVRLTGPAVAAYSLTLTPCSPYNCTPSAHALESIEIGLYSLSPLLDPALDPELNRGVA